MKKSFCFLRVSAPLFVILLFVLSPFSAAADPVTNCACIGNDTLICGFSLELVPETSGGEWSVLCDSTAGSVVFDLMNPDTASITVSNCGEYHLIYSVDDGSCISSDTIIAWFDDPSSISAGVSTNATLSYDNVECHESPPPSLCDGTITVMGLPEPTVSWNVCATANGIAAIFSTDVQGNMPATCTADSILIDVQTFLRPQIWAVVILVKPIFSITFLT